MAKKRIHNVARSRKKKPAQAHKKTAPSQTLPNGIRIFDAGKPRGETIEQFLQRSFRKAVELKKQYPGGRVAFGAEMYGNRTRQTFLNYQELVNYLLAGNSIDFDEDREADWLKHFHLYIMPEGTPFRESKFKRERKPRQQKAAKKPAKKSTRKVAKKVSRKIERISKSITKAVKKRFAPAKKTATKKGRVSNVQLQEQLKQAIAEIKRLQKQLAAQAKPKVTRKVVKAKPMKVTKKVVKKGKKLNVKKARPVTKRVVKTITRKQKQARKPAKRGRK